MSELGPDKPIIKKLLRVREEIIGKNPINRDEFDPNHILTRVFDVNDDVEIMDSNDLNTGWRMKLMKVNPDSKYIWALKW